MRIIIKKDVETKTLRQIKMDNAIDYPPKSILSDAIRIKLNKKLDTWIVEEKYLRKTDIYQLAAELDTNQKYLALLIKEKYGGKNFTEFVCFLRIQYILMELKTNKSLRNYSIDSLSEHLGFNSKTTFYKAFRKYTGFTPSHYIRSLT